MIQGSKCMICGEILGTGDVNGKCLNCSYSDFISDHSRKGWICVVCGASNNPDNKLCEFCSEIILS